MGLRKIIHDKLIGFFELLFSGICNLHMVNEDIEMYSKIKESIYFRNMSNPNKINVVYPYCGRDITPTRVFKETTLIEPNYSNGEALRSMWGKVIECDPRDYPRYNIPTCSFLLAQNVPENVVKLPSLCKIVGLVNGGYVLTKSDSRLPSDFFYLDRFESHGKSYSLYTRITEEKERIEMKKS